MSYSVLPGDKIAVIEEYEAGNNTCDDGHIVRATVIGESEIDQKERVVNVKNKYLIIDVISFMFAFFKAKK